MKARNNNEVTKYDFYYKTILTEVQMDQTHITTRGSERKTDHKLLFTVKLGYGVMQ